MKAYLFFGWIATAGLSLAGPAIEATSGRLTREELAERQRRMMERDRESGSQRTEEAAAPIAPQPKSLLERSDILSFGSTATLVPKGAVLKIPLHLKDRVAMERGSRIVNWLDFQTSNRGWVSTVEVTLAQAEGKEALPESLLRYLENSANVVVATFEGGPISVHQKSTKSNSSPENP